MFFFHLVTHTPTLQGFCADAHRFGVRNCWYYSVADILSVPSFFFCQEPQVPSGLWVTLRGRCGVWAILGYPSGYPTDT